MALFRERTHLPLFGLAAVLVGGLFLLAWGAMRAMTDERRRLGDEAERLERQEANDRESSRRDRHAVDLDRLFDTAKGIANAQASENGSWPPEPTAPNVDVWAVYDETGRRLWPLFPRPRYAEDVRAAWPVDERLSLRAADESANTADAARLLVPLAESSIHPSVRAAAMLRLAEMTLRRNDRETAERFIDQIATTGLSSLSTAEADHVIMLLLSRPLARENAAAWKGVASLCVGLSVHDGVLARDLLTRADTSGRTAAERAAIDPRILSEMQNTWGLLPWRSEPVAADSPPRAELGDDGQGAISSSPPSVDRPRGALSPESFVRRWTKVREQSPRSKPSHGAPPRRCCSSSGRSCRSPLGFGWRRGRCVAAKPKTPRGRNSLATTAHQLKTPVSNLRLFVETLHAGRATTTDERRKLEEILMLESERLGNYLERLLAFQRLDSGAVGEVTVFDVAVLVREAAERWKRVTELRGLGFVLRLPEESLPVRGDHGAFAEALQNILDNAVRWTRPGGAVALEAQLTGSSIAVLISDEGPGIPVVDQPRIFEPFFSGAETRSRGEGTGLGLAIARAGVRGPGDFGTGVDRAPWKRVQNPLAESRGKRMSDRRFSVLVVEDDQHLRFGLEFNLQKEGYELWVAASAEEAETLLAKRTPDLAIFDIMLPGKSGLELLRTVRERGANYPVLMLTARSDESDVVTALSLGADDYVKKPFGLAELLARVAAILRRWGEGRNTTPSKTTLGPWTLDLANLRARSTGVEVLLTHLEVEILTALLLRRGEVKKREELLERIWGVSSTHLTRTLDNHVARLRKKLEVEPQTPRLILTVHGVGYRMATDEGA